MNKFINKLFIGAIFSWIPMLLVLLCAVIGFKDIFRIIFLVQFSLMCCYGEGFLAEKYRNNNK